MAEENIFIKYRGGVKKGKELLSELHAEHCSTSKETIDYIIKYLGNKYDVEKEIIKEGVKWTVYDKEYVRLDNMEKLADFVDKENPTPLELERWYYKQKSENASKLIKIPEETRRKCEDNMFDAVNALKTEKNPRIKKSLEDSVAYYAGMLGYDHKKVLGEK